MTGNPILGVKELIDHGNAILTNGWSVKATYQNDG